MARKSAKTGTNPGQKASRPSVRVTKSLPHGHRPKPKNQKRRRDSITLADLFMWITIVDECHHHPIGAFGRAALFEGCRSPSVVQQRVDVLERHFGRLFIRGAKRGEVGRQQKRVPVLTPKGALLAELFVAIEHLYFTAVAIANGRASMAGFEIPVLDIKKQILTNLPIPIRRAFDNEVIGPQQRKQDADGGYSCGRSRMSRTRAWYHRLHKARVQGVPLYLVKRMRPPK